MLILNEKFSSVRQTLSLTSEETSLIKFHINDCRVALFYVYVRLVQCKTKGTKVDIWILVIIVSIYEHCERPVRGVG